MEPSTIEFAIVHELQKRGPLGFEDLLRLIPTCTWNQMFTVIDRLSREGKLSLQHPDRFTYQVSLARQRVEPQSDSRLAS